MLTWLVEQLRSAPAGVDDPEAVIEVAILARREARKSKPDKRILSGLLQTLMAGVIDSATLTSSVIAIQDAVSVAQVWQRS
jgi:hypothetical protein